MATLQDPIFSFHNLVFLAENVVFFVPVRKKEKIGEKTLYKHEQMYYNANTTENSRHNICFSGSLIFVRKRGMFV